MRTNKPKKNVVADITKVNSVDICQTPPHALEPLYPYLKKDWHIWESACGPEQILVSTLRGKGYSVWATDLSRGEEYNFFSYVPTWDNYPIAYDIQVTNPPYSVKYEWIERSFALGKRFALLVPYETHASARFQKLFAKYNGKPWQIEILAPERRIVYKMPYKGWDSSPQMPTCWITFGLDIYKQRQDYLKTFYVPMRNVKYTNDNVEI